MNIYFPSTQWGKNKKAGIETRQRNVMMPDISLPVIDRVWRDIGFLTFSEWVKSLVAKELTELGHTIHTEPLK